MATFTVDTLGIMAKFRQRLTSTDAEEQLSIRKVMASEFQGFASEQNRIAYVSLTMEPAAHVNTSSASLLKYSGGTYLAPTESASTSLLSWISNYSN